MLRRGFKTWSETLALQVRKDLGLGDTDPLDARRLSEYMGVRLLTPDVIDGLPIDVVQMLVGRYSENWSAVTVVVGSSHAIVFNPQHSDRRQSSDLMHEIAHILIEHEPDRIIMSGDTDLVLRTYDEAQEDEAHWLAGCLLLPRPALIWIEDEGLSAEQACRKFVVSNKLYMYRRNVTGVAIQMKRRRQPSAKRRA